MNNNKFASNTTNTPNHLNQSINPGIITGNPQPSFASNTQQKETVGTKRMLARDYDKFSPIRQIGAQIGTDYNSVPPMSAAGIGIAGLNGGKGTIQVGGPSSDDKSGAFLSHDIDIDSADNLSSSHINHSTLSPQRLHSIREEGGVVGAGNIGGRIRILESQPGGQTIGEPLWSANLDSQKRPRGGFSRPFTNSPFPYMQKRSAKTKFQQQQISQGPLPSTAATSSNNQQLSIINEVAPGTAGAHFINNGLNFGTAAGVGSNHQGVIGSAYHGARVNGISNSSFAQQLLRGDESGGFQFNSNNITSLQQNLKQNMAGTVIINNGGGPSSQNQSFRNGALNFGYNLGSEGSGMIGVGGFERERVLSGGGPSDDSSFYQFNDRSAILENEDSAQKYASIGSGVFSSQPKNNIDNADTVIERRNSQPHYNPVPRSKATIDVNAKYNGGNNNSSANQGAAQTVHLRRIINKDNSAANSPPKDAQKLTAAGNNTSNYYVVNSNKGKKRKILTEPQSPQEFSSHFQHPSQQQFAFTHQNLENQLHSLNPSNNNSRDLPIRLSGNKVGQGKGGSVGPVSQQSSNTNQAHYNSVQANQSSKVKGHLKKHSLDAVSGPRLNHHFNNVEENQSNHNHHYQSAQKYNGVTGGAGVSSYYPSAALVERNNNSSLENHTQDDRGRLLSEERQSSFLPRLDAHQRQTNSQVMYRDLDENNKSQLRERVDMSMRSPTNNWVNDSIPKIAASKKSLSTERKNPVHLGAQSSTIQHTNNSSSSDINKIFKPQIKNANNKGTRHQKQAASSVVQGLSPAGALTGLNGIHVLNHQHSQGGSSNNLGLGSVVNQENSQFFKELNRPSDQSGPLKGIGKIQPFNSEFKLNEQVIRGKLQANASSTSNNRNMQVQIKNVNGVALQDSINSSSKPSVGSSNHDNKLMINVTRGSNLQLIPLTEVSSPNNLSSPMNSGGSTGNSAMQMLIHQASLGNNGTLNQSSAQQNRLKLQSQDQNLVNSQFLSSFERMAGAENHQNLYRAGGAISSLSQDLQNVMVQSPGGTSSVSNQQMHSNYLQNHSLQQMNQNENIRPFNYRNFSVSQTSSKESSSAMIGGILNNITPQKSMGDGPGTTSQDYSVTPNSQFMYDEELNNRSEITGLRTQHSSGQVNLQNNLIEVAHSVGRQLFSPPQQQIYHNYATQNSSNSVTRQGGGAPMSYFEQSNSNINFIDINDQSLLNGGQTSLIPNLNTINGDPHSLNSAGGQLTLRSQNSQQYQINHSIKTVASKQIPKCFRMSKQQLQQITNKVASRGSVYNGGVIPFGPSSGLAKSSKMEGGSGANSNQHTPQGVQNQEQSQFQQSPSQFNQKALGLGAGSNLADNRVSFNDYSQFQTMQKQQQQNQQGLVNGLALQNLASINHNSSPMQGQNQKQQYPMPTANTNEVAATVTHNNIFSSGGQRRRSFDHDDKQSLMDRDISERSVDEERERMTPAFNNRVKLDSMRNTQNASAAGGAGGGKNGTQDPAQINAFKQVTINIPNESHINAMNHTLNSKGINLTEAIASAKID